MPTSTTLRAYALLSPALVTVTLVLTVCLAIMLVLSVSLQHYLSIDIAWTLQNYRELLGNVPLRHVILRTAAVSGIVTILSLLLAYPMAYFVAFDLERNKVAWLLLMTLPFWISYLLRIFAWKVILGLDGVINSSLMGLGLISKPLEFLLYNPIAVTITLSHAWAAYAILPIYVSLEKIDRSLLEAATDLGDNPRKRFLRVTFPLSLPGTIASTLLVFIPTVGDYVTPTLVGGTSGMMIGSVIQSLVTRSDNAPMGAAVSVVMMLFVTLLVCVFLWSTGYRRRSVQE